MGENSPYPFSPPSHPPPPPPKTTMPMLYYGLAVVGTSAVVIAIYNLIIIKWCANHRQRLRDINQEYEARIRSSTSRRSLDNLGAGLKYKKEGEDSIQLEFDNFECPVCLSVFEEEEEVRQLPMCKHSFHAPCIDMWLYTHLDCPLCRASVSLPEFPRQSVTTPETENSREVLIDQGSFLV